MRRVTLSVSLRCVAFSSFFLFLMYVSGAFFPPPHLFLVTKHKGTEKRESPSPAPKPRKVELSE